MLEMAYHITPAISELKEENESTYRLLLQRKLIRENSGKVELSREGIYAYCKELRNSYRDTHRDYLERQFRIDGKLQPFLRIQNKFGKPVFTLLNLLRPSESFYKYSMYRIQIPIGKLDFQSLEVLTHS